MSQGDLDVFIHIDGKTNPVDVGTKAVNRAQEGLKNTLRIVNEGHYDPQESTDHQNTFGANYTTSFTSVDLEEVWNFL